MRFVKFKEEEGTDIIVGKEYQIKFENEEGICFVDDLERVDVVSKNDGLEIIDRPVMVKAWDNDDFKLELELIHDLGEEFEYRYICKNENSIAGWRYIEYIEEELTLEQRVEKLEQKLNK